MTSDPIVAIDARLYSTRNTGDTAYWRGLIHSLLDLGSGPQVLLFSNTSCPAGVPADVRSRWRHIPARNSRWWSLVQFPLMARKAGAQVFHTQYNVSPLVKRPVLTIHDVSFFVGPEWFKPKDRFLLRTQVPRSAKRSKVILTVSETSKAEIERYIPAAKNKTRVTYNSLDPGFTPISRGEAKSLVSESFGLVEPFIFTLGTKWPRKNISLALDTVNLLPQQIPHRLVVAGQAGWGELGHCERALFPGYVDNQAVAALYAAADIYLCPSFHEGFGIPLLEAFASRTPVVCSSGGALPEIAASAALVVKDFNAQTWANEVTALLEDSGKLEHMRNAGLCRLSDFSWKRTAELTFDAYLEAASA